MASFFGTFVNKVDSKGRVSVPALFRVELAGQRFNGIAVMPSLKHPAVQCSGLDFMDDLKRRISQIDLLSEQHDVLSASLIGDTTLLPFDGEGRIVLPTPLAGRAALDGTAAFFGRGSYFEIWEPKALEAHKAAARSRVLEMGLTLPPRQDERA
jgi:MraZ protein